MRLEFDTAVLSAGKIDIVASCSGMPTGIIKAHMKKAWTHSLISAERQNSFPCC